MALTSTNSVWHDARHDAPGSDPWPVGPLDVVVVGGGLAGLCTALLCAQEGAAVAVLEARTLAAGTTGSSTAKVTALQGLIYHSLRRGKSLGAAATFALANTDAVGRLRELATRLPHETGWTDAAAFTCAATPRGVRAIEQEAEAARDAGLAVRVVTDTELPLTVERAVVLDGQAHVDPVRFCDAIVAELRRLGVTVVTGVRATAVEEDAARCTVRVEDGRELHADAAVQATHLPITDPAFLAARVRPERSYVVSGPLRGSATPPTGMYLAHDAGWSLRPATADGEPVLLVGGEGHPMARDDDPSNRLQRLATFASDALGVSVDHRWSAFDYTTTDGVPYLGRLSPGSRRRYVATGFRKWGMSTSMVAAVVISELIAGRPDPYAGEFDATRIVPTVSRDLVRNNAQVTRRFVGDRVRARVRPSDRLPEAGDGTILRRDGADVAVARTHDGRLLAVRAACTHLGCLVAHNAADQSWDCPCHGSRFDLDGTVLEGPAATPLEHVQLDVDDARRAP
jgi:glycine/D-amino acid oxidase-like deaminating enzyme/nitrite reductase/ring-hydroxylating ferredoxin subunit